MDITTKLRDGIGELSLNRPSVKNALTIDLLQALDQGIDELAQQGAAAAVLRGEEGVFCAGADLAVVRSAFDGDDPAARLGPMVDHLHAVIRKLREQPFPVVVAVEGFAVGAGMGLALAADVRVMGRGAQLVPGYLGIGASPDGGVSYFLTRALGAHRATGILLRNEAVDGERAGGLGLADEVVDDEEVAAAAHRAAQGLAHLPPLALVRTRRLVDHATTHPLSQHLDAEREAVGELWPSHDFREGVGAFLERRQPHFTGA